MSLLEVSNTDCIIAAGIESGKAVQDSLNPMKVRKKWVSRCRSLVGLGDFVPKLFKDSKGPRTDLIGECVGNIGLDEMKGVYNAFQVSANKYY